MKDESITQILNDEEYVFILYDAEVCIAIEYL